MLILKGPPEAEAYAGINPEAGHNERDKEQREEVFFMAGLTRMSWWGR